MSSKKVELYVHICDFCGEEIRDTEDGIHVKGNATISDFNIADHAVHLNEGNDYHPKCLLILLKAEFRIH